MDKRAKINRVLARLLEVGEELEESVLDAFLHELHEVSYRRTEQPPE